jgi:hypothetical protein
MTRAFVASALASGLVWMALPTSSASAQAGSGLENSQVDIAYVEPSNPVFQPIHERLKQRRVLEELRQFLAPLRLPRKILVKSEQCDRESRPYEPGGPVTICYEYVHQLEKFASRIPAGERTPRGVRREDAVVGGFVQIVLHEMSLVVFDMIGVPVWGRERDAADKLAGFLMLQFGTDTARKLLNGAAYFFEASDRTWTGSDFSDERGTEAQRFYNYLCIAYGGDQQAFKDFVAPTGQQVSRPKGGGASAPPRTDLLPERRIPWCRSEYFTVQYSFETTIMPYVDRDLLQQVLAREWLQSDDGK